MAPSKVPPQPTIFKRGSTFSYLVSIPTTVPAKFFMDWEVFAQMRRFRDTSPRGLIADLASRWMDTNSRKLVIFHALTDDWPTGLAEMDVVFINGSGFRQRAQSIKFDIQPGVTQK